jgi:NodT family efflux transporter outer membrane factor (OMF) lipoprotein
MKPEPVVVQASVPAAPQQSWVEQAPEDFPTTDWVSTFSDPQLNALVDEALRANTDIGAARASYQAALARINISEADLLPRVSGSADLSRSERRNFDAATNIGYGINASWEADIWGRIKDQVRSSELSAAASNADYAGVRLAIAGQVTQNWFNLIEARLLAELAQRDLETQERALRLTTRRFEGGVTGSSDVRLARSSLAASQAALAVRQQNLASIARALEVLLRRYPSYELRAAADLPVLPPLTGAGDQAYLLRRRPDLLAAEQRMLAAGVDVDIARKSLLPSISLSGGLNTGGTAINNIFDIDGIVANLASGLTQPIFQGGRLKANIEQQEYILAQLLESYAGEALGAYVEVENALDAETRLAEREAALRISLEEATKAEQRLEIRYSEGLATILQLLDAQSRRISAESQLISARKERLANRVRLHVALGGGIETQEVLLASRG